MIRFLAFVLGLVLLARAAHADSVILVGVDADDPYHAVAVRLAEGEDGTSIVRFDPDAPEAVLERLREIVPTHAIFVMRPEQIHVNSVRRILRMAARVDADPFVDFEFGYVTGATADEALAFADRIRRARTAERPAPVARASVGGGADGSSASDGTYQLGSASWPLRSLQFVAPEGGHGRDQAFLDEYLSRLEGCGAILLGGHGMPWEIGSGPRAEDLAGLDLFPAVAFNYACYTGVTARWPQRRFDAGDYVSDMHEVEAERSFALAMIRAGAVGYVAYVNPRPAGPEMTIDFERTLAGESLGAVRRRDYAKIALGYLGFGEPGIVPPPWVEGERRPRAEVEPVRHMMLDGATGGILYGDPSFTPYPARADDLPLKTTVVREGEGLRITLEMPGSRAYLWGADPYRSAGGRTMAMKLYDRVELPDGVAEIRSVRVVEATRGGEPLDTLDPVWALEEDQGRRYLHVKPGFTRGGRGDLRIVLVAGSDAPPPDLARRADGVRLAREVGEAILARVDELENAWVYEGRAGVALFLLDLFGATEDARFRKVADALLDAAPSDGADAGLYTGLAGFGQVLLEARRVTGDDAYLERAVEIAERLPAPDGTDVISGAAGTGFFLLQLHRVTGDDVWLARAKAIGAYLDAEAMREDGGARWRVSEDLDRVYVGFSHGAAGIGTFLVALSEATGEEPWLDLAREAATFVIARAHDDGAFGWEWTKRVPPAADAYPVQWCHGSPGIALFFLALADATGNPAHEEALARSVTNLRTRGRTARSGGCLCHGKAGNAEVLLDIGRRRRNAEWIALARTWAGDLIENGTVRLGLGNHRYGPDYMLGLAGIGRFLLRLADPASVPPAFLPPEGEGDAFLDRVRAANQAALRPGAASDAAVAELAPSGARAFRAVCRLIAAGEGHYRTHELLRATAFSGGEDLLRALADGPPLPRYGRWTALQGLGAVDSPDVRTYLLARLGRERDAGLFMSTAKALAMLEEKRAVPDLARQLLAFEDGWSGVESHLVGALGALGEEAVDSLIDFATDDRAGQGGNVLRALAAVHRSAPTRGRETAGIVLATDRFGTFPAAIQERIRALAGRE